MLKIYINGSDASAHLDEGSVSIVGQIQQKADTLGFSLRPGATAPSELEEVKLWDVVEIVSASGTAVVVKDKLTSGLSILDFGKFRAGERFWLGVGAAGQERVEISAIAVGASGQVNVTLTAAMTASHSAGDLAGKLVFGGTLSGVVKTTPRTLEDVEFRCDAVDYTKIFDKKNVNDSWSDRDGRGIVNDFVNTTVNYNLPIDEMEYADSAAVQAEWIESGDGGNPTLNTADRVQGESAVSFPWTFSGGTASFAATPVAQDLSDLVGVASGQPTKGNLTLWYKRGAATGITSLKLRIGSSSGNYAEVTFVPEADVDTHFKSLELEDATVTGTPDWTACDYAAIVVVETATGSIVVDDVRVTADGSFTLYGVEATDEFDDVRAAFKKPTALMQSLADALGAAWNIDYERDIRLFARSSYAAPFTIGDGTDNFDRLAVRADVSQLKNRQDVRGGTRRTTETYSQVVVGNDAAREWLLKTEFAELTVKLDNNTSTDTMEATTTTTTVKATAHGLATGDYVVNRSRSNAVRQVTVVDVDHFTVEAVPSQANGDTFSKFATAKTDGVENLDDEASFDYMSSFSEKSVRASAQTATLRSGEFLLFTYVEVVPVRAQVTDFVSVAAMKAIIGGDGIFDGAAIVDDSLDSIQAARDRAQAEVDQYSNPIVTVSFRTDHEGLESGQLLRVTDAAKGIDADYLIQRVKADYRSGDRPTFEVQCASTLFGIIEYFQKLSKALSDRKVSEDDTIEQFIANAETVTLADVTVVSTSHNPQAEAITVADAAIAQPLNYATVFVAGPYTPTIALNGADHKRVFLVDGSYLG